MPGEYFSDEDHLKSWMEVEKDAAAFAQFLEDHIFGVRDFAEYLDQCGGLRWLQRELLLQLGKCAFVESVLLRLANHAGKLVSDSEGTT